MNKNLHTTRRGDRAGCGTDEIRTGKGRLLQAGSLALAFVLAGSASAGAQEASWLTLEEQTEEAPQTGEQSSFSLIGDILEIGNHQEEDSQEADAEASSETAQDAEAGTSQTAQDPEAGTSRAAQEGEAETSQTAQGEEAETPEDGQEAKADAVSLQNSPRLDGILVLDQIAVTAEKINPASRRLQLAFWGVNGQALPGQILVRISPLEGEGEPLVLAAKENEDGAAVLYADLADLPGTQFAAELFLAEEGVILETSHSAEDAAGEEPATENELATESATEELATENETNELATESATEEPTTENETNELATESVSEEPTTENETNELATESVSEEPATEIETNELATESATEEPATETETNDLASESVTEEPATETETNDLAPESATEEPATELIVDEAALEDAQPLGCFRFELINAGQNVYVSAGTEGALCSISAQDRAVLASQIQNVIIRIYAEESGEEPCAQYDAQLDAETGLWQADVNPGDIPGIGTYKVRAEFLYKDGGTVTTSEAAFHTAFEEYENIKCTKVSKKKNILKYRIYDVDPQLPDEALKIALWQQEDRSDLNWYDAQRRKDGSCRLQAEADRYEADYEQIHAGTLYVDDMKSSFMQEEEETTYARPDVQINAIPAIATAASNGADEAEDFKLTAEHVPGAGGTLQDLRFEVWGEENGRNDVRWYAAQEEEDTFAASMQVRDHGEAGEYHIRTWMYFADGNVLAGNDGSFEVPAEGSAVIAVEDTDAPALTARLAVSDIQLPEQVTDLAALVYNKEGTQKRHWYQGRENADGTWSIRVDASYHDLMSGEYEALVYAGTQNGLRIPLGTTTFSLKEAQPQLQITRKGRSPFFDITAEGMPSAGWNLDEVTFLVSSADKPNKVLGKTKAEIADGAIRGTIRMNEIGEPGDYIVRAQLDFRNASSYRLGESSIHYTRVPFTKAAQVLDQIGWDLMAAFRWSAGMTYYGHNGIMPEDDLPGIHWFANYGFDNYQGNCYVMAATFYEMAVDLGYTGRQISGGVGLRVGGIGPHSWVELDLEDGTWVYDPNFTNESGGNGFKIHYTDPGTWSYQMGHAMKLYDQR